MLLLSLVFVATATAARAAAAPGDEISCPAPVTLLAVPPGYPAGIRTPDTPRAFLPEGRYNWSAGYTLQSMVYHLAATHDPAWAARIVDSGEAILAARNAASPLDGQPYAWIDSNDAAAGYAWLGFIGHMFTPLMQFARVVTADARLGACTYRGHSLRDYASGYLAEFNRAADARRAELRTGRGTDWYVFSLPVPASVAELQGQVLPVNMNADMFLALLHAAAAETALGSDARAQEKRAAVAGYVRYLNEEVLVRRPCGPGRACLLWNYSRAMNRADDVGHANMVAKFLLDAYQDGYPVRPDDLVALANTVDGLVDESGTVQANLLDGRTIPRVTRSVYYLILYGPFVPGLQAKMDRLVAGSRLFAYTGPWLAAHQPR